MSDPTRPLRRLTVGVTGSVHAALLPAYCDVLRAHVADEIRIVMTPAASQFVLPNALRHYSSGDVLNDPSAPVEGAAQMSHIEAAEWADHLLVLPATANSIGMIACGLASNALLSTVLAFQGRLIIAPAMNKCMWESPRVQRNLDTLRLEGAWVIEPQPCEALAASSPSQDGGVSPTPRLVVDALRASLGCQDRAAPGTSPNGGRTSGRHTADALRTP